MRTKTFLSCFVFTLVVGAATAWSQPALVPIQGHLMDEDGGAITANDLQVTIALYENELGGASFHTEAVLLDVVNGSFVHYLGTADALDLDEFDGRDVYVGISVNGEVELLPRLPLATTAYAAYARGAGTVPWSGITGIPADIADGDSDTTYTSIAPIELVGTSFGLSATGCAAGEGWIWSGTDWQCEPAASTTYLAGTGLTLIDGTFAINPAVTQRRVSGTCIPGSYIIAISSDGTVECEPLPPTADYTASAGVQRIGNDFSADTAFLQRRVSGSCVPGSYIIAIASNGTVECEPIPDGIEYTAGNGLSLTGSQFSINTAQTQARVTGECPAGQYMRSIASNGTVACLPLPEGVSYNAGTGLILSGDTFSVNTTTIQSRVTGSCASGFYVRAIAANGTVTCQQDQNTDTTYSAGTGISFSGTQINVDSGYVQRRVSSACAANQAIRAIGADGSITCSNISAGTITAVNAGFGLTGGGTSGSVSLAVNDGQIQRRVTGTCNTNQKVIGINADGSVVCAADIDTNSGGTITGVTVSGGLTGGGTSGNVSVGVNSAVIQSRVTGTCGADEAVWRVNQNGTVDCRSVRSARAENAMRASANSLMGGGFMYFYGLGQEFRWDTRFIIISHGRGSNFATNGHFDINRPPAGTIATGVGVGDRAFTGLGMPMNCWESLYYILPIGAGSGTQNGNFRIVGYTTGTYDIPAEWVHLATANCDYGGGRLMVNANGGVWLHPTLPYYTDYPYLIESTCEWFWDVNDWDAAFTFYCPVHSHMTGTYSHHNNHREDRRYSFFCCRYLRY